MKKEYPRISVSLVLNGAEMVFKEVTDIIGVSPTSMRTPDDWPIALKKQAEKLPRELRPRYEWYFGTSREYCTAVSTKFEELLSLLNGRENAIKEFCQVHELSIGFVVVIETLDDDRPEIVLTSRIIKLIADINAEIGFDIYNDISD